MKAKGLGKGLNALLSQEILEDSIQDGVKYIEINDIEPNSEQPRKAFNQQELEELSESIREHGVLQPIIVRQKNDKYEIVAGERRYRAARLAKLDTLPILIKDISDQQTLEISLVENIQREELNSMELAYAYNLLMERFDLNQEQVAQKVGKSRSAVANIMRLLQLPIYIQEKLRQNEISYGHARAILSIKDKTLQNKALDYIIEKKLSVRETEKYIKLLLMPKGKKIKETNPFYKEIQENLQKILGTKVNISKGKKKGKIEIEYYSEEELETIINKIRN